MSFHGIALPAFHAPRFAPTAAVHSKAVRPPGWPVFHPPPIPAEFLFRQLVWQALTPHRTLLKLPAPPAARSPPVPHEAARAARPFARRVVQASKSAFV